MAVALDAEGEDAQPEEAVEGGVVGVGRGCGGGEEPGEVLGAEGGMVGGEGEGVVVGAAVDGGAAVC